MASFKLSEAYVELRADDAKLVASLGRVRSNVEATHKKMSQLATTARGVFLGIAAAAGVGVGIGAFVEALKESITVAAGTERGVARLRETLRLLGYDAGAGADQLEQFGAALKSSLKVDSDTTRNLITTALNLGIARDSVEDVVKAAIGLSQVTGQDLPESLLAMTQAVDGNFRTLQRQLPELRKMKDEMSATASDSGGMGKYIHGLDKANAQEQKLTTREKQLQYVQQVANRGLAERKKALDGVSGSMDAAALAAKDLARELGTDLAPATIFASKQLELMAHSLAHQFEAASAENIGLSITITKWHMALREMLGMNPLAEDQQQLDKLNAELNKLTNDAIKSDNSVATIRKQNLSQWSDAMANVGRGQNALFAANAQAAMSSPAYKAMIAEQERLAGVEAKNAARNAANQPNYQKKVMSAKDWVAQYQKAADALKEVDEMEKHGGQTAATKRLKDKNYNLLNEASFNIAGEGDPRRAHLADYQERTQRNIRSSQNRDVAAAKAQLAADEAKLKQQGNPVSPDFYKGLREKSAMPGGIIFKDISTLNSIIIKYDRMISGLNQEVKNRRHAIGADRPGITSNKLPDDQYTDFINAITNVGTSIVSALSNSFTLNN